jgi:hypothetical protein
MKGHIAPNPATQPHFAVSRNAQLGRDCVAHACTFFDRPAFDLASAQPGSFIVAPAADMLDGLRKDYAAMRGMIFGEARSFEAILDSVAALEVQLNNGPGD